MANQFFIQPADYSQSLRGLTGIVNQYGQQQQQQLGEQAGQLFESGTPDEIAKFSLQNPSFGKALTEQIGHRNDATKKNMLESMQGIITNPANTEQILADRIKMVTEEGGDPTQSSGELAEYQADPERYVKGVRNLYAVLDPNGSTALSAAEKAGRADTMTAYQKATVEGKKVDQELRRSEAENKRDENKLKRETDDLKRQELQQKIDARNQKTSEAKENKFVTAQGVVDQGGVVLDLIGNIERHPGFSSAVGAKGASSGFGILDEPISGTEAAGAQSLIDTLEAKNFLTAIGEFKSAGGAGSLSDAEGKKLGAAISSLSTSQSESDFKKSLNVIRDMVSKQTATAKKQAKRPVTSKNKVESGNANAPAGNFSSLWGG